MENNVRRRWPKIVGLTLLGLVTAIGIGVGIAYWQLRPEHHFARVPVLAGPENQSAHKEHGPFNVLILGNDARNPNEPARTDSIMLVHVDFVNHEYNVLSIPRDTRVYLPGYGYTKITHAAYMGELNGGSKEKGALDAVKAVSRLTGVPINYYAETSFDGLKDMIDAVGGVNMYVPFTVTLQKDLQVPGQPTVIEKGYHELNGQMVLSLARERKTAANGDFSRQQLQKEALVALAKKIAQPSQVIHLPRVISNLSKFLVSTNMSNQDMISIALGAKGFSSNQIHYYQVPGTDGYFLDPIVKAQLYYWIPDQAKLNQIIQEHFVD